MFYFRRFSTPSFLPYSRSVVSIIHAAKIMYFLETTKCFCQNFFARFFSPLEVSHFLSFCLTFEAFKSDLNPLICTLSHYFQVSDTLLGGNDWFVVKKYVSLRLSFMGGSSYKWIPLFRTGCAIVFCLFGDCQMVTVSSKYGLSF